MKKLVIIFNIALVLLASCTTQKMGTSAYNDDVYANPKEDRIIEAKIAAEKKQAQDAADKRYNDSIAAVKKAQQEKDDANPYYKDREFKYDDYYDYEYATRVKRFNNRIDGLSYYDNYYTNSYWYNPNPYNYGVSVYNGYSWWGASYNAYSYNPSINFYSNWGWGCNSGYGYGGYNPYMAGYMQGYNNGFNNGLYGNYYGYGNPYYSYASPFGYNYGYGNPYGYGGYGYNNPYNNGWGYYNSYDHNSSYTYGPRSSHGGGNSRRTSNPGLIEKRDSYTEKFVKSVSEQQVRDRDTKFSNISPVRAGNYDEPVRVNNNGVPIKNGGVRPTINEGTPTRNTTTPVRNDNSFEEPVKQQSNTPIRVKEEVAPVRQQQAPVRQTPIKVVEPVKQFENMPRKEAPARSNDNFQVPSTPSNNGGGNTPSNNGGGRRPR